MDRTRCLKLVSTFFSFFSLGGGAIAGFGIWSLIHRKPSEVLEEVDDETLNTVLSMGAPIMISLGGVLAFMGMVGFCGAVKEKRWMLLVFFIVMFIILILQVSASVFLLLPYAVKEKSLSGLESKLVKNIQENYKQGQTSLWDDTMNNLKCCGYKGYEDFTETDFVRKTFSYPLQCCGGDQNTKCEKEEAMKKKVRGCIHVLLSENIPISGALCFLIAVLEILSMFVSLKVYRFLHESES